MTAEDIIKIINCLPEYIVYIYPGYITIYTYYFLRGNTLKDTKQILLKSILISYIYVAMTDFLPISNVFLVTAGYILLSFIVAYISFRITKSEWILKIFDLLKISTTYYENDIDSLAGIENSAWLIVYLKNDNIAYEGSLGNKELEEGKERYIALEAYTKYTVKANGSLGKKLICYKGNYKESCVIKYTDIKYIEKRDTTPIE